MRAKSEEYGAKPGEVSKVAPHVPRRERARARTAEGAHSHKDPRRSYQDHVDYMTPPKR